MLRIQEIGVFQAGREFSKSVFHLWYEFSNHCFSVILRIQQSLLSVMVRIQQPLFFSHGTNSTTTVFQSWYEFNNHCFSVMVRIQQPLFFSHDTNSTITVFQPLYKLKKWTFFEPGHEFSKVFFKLWYEFNEQVFVNQSCRGTMDSASQKLTKHFYAKMNLDHFSLETERTVCWWWRDPLLLPGRQNVPEVSRHSAGFSSCHLLCQKTSQWQLHCRSAFRAKSLKWTYDGEVVSACLIIVTARRVSIKFGIGEFVFRSSFPIPVISVRPPPPPPVWKICNGFFFVDVLVLSFVFTVL
jgi:hypothetical protein